MPTRSIFPKNRVGKIAGEIRAEPFGRGRRFCPPYEPAIAHPDELVAAVADGLERIQSRWKLNALSSLLRGRIFGRKTGSHFS